MPPHLGPRLFITGIPTAGKSFLAKKLAEKTGGLHVCLDDAREELAGDDHYKKWVNFYIDQDEKKYWNYIQRHPRSLIVTLRERFSCFFVFVLNLAPVKSFVVFPAYNVIVLFALYFIKRGAVPPLLELYFSLLLSFYGCVLASLACIVKTSQN